MPIDNFTRQRDYFAARTVIKAADLDSQFNNLTNYINEKIVPAINALLGQVIVGSTIISDEHKLLKNIGDGVRIEWSFITNDVIDDNTFSLSKIEKIDPNSVFIGVANHNIEIITSGNTGECLVSQITNNDLAWQKLTGENLEDYAIKGKHVIEGTITSDNLEGYLLHTLLGNDVLDSTRFQDSAITKEKAALKDAGNGLTQAKLSAELKQEWSTAIWSNIIPDNYISASAISVSVSGDDINSSRLFEVDEYIPSSKFVPFAPENLKEAINDPKKIAQNSINGMRFCPVVVSQNIPPLSIEWVLSKDSIDFEHLDPTLRGILQG